MSINTKLEKPQRKTRQNFLDYITKQRWTIPLALIILYIVLYSIIFPEIFLTSYNITAVLLEFSIPVIIVIGMAIQLINGEIDLSVGYNVMFSNMLVGTLIVLGIPTILAVFITIAIACLFGTIIGLLVSRIGVNSFIATLGLGLIFYGLTQFLYSAIFGISNSGVDIQHLPNSFTAISKTELLGLQLPVYYAVVLIAVFSYLMAKTRFFKKFYYIGMNKEAAELSGINVRNMKTAAFIFSTLFASLAGVLLTARMGSSATTFGKGWELKIITACVIGGVSMKGGRGTMIGAILGMLFTICLNNALRIADAPSTLYKIIEGLVLLGAVILDAQFSKRKVMGH